MPTLTRSIASFTLKSTWKYKTANEDRTYIYYTNPTTPSTASKTVSVDLSSIPAGSRVTAATLKITTARATCVAKASGKSYTFSGNNQSGINVLPWFSSLGSSLSVMFTYQESSVSGSSNSSSGSMSCYFSNISLSITYELPASGGTVDVSTIEAGPDSTISVTINPSNPNYSHVVTWQLGNATETDVLAVGETVSEFDIPMSLCNQIPNATSGEGTVTIETYNGETLMGSNSYPFTVTVPDTVVPTAGTMTATPVTSGVDQSIANMFIQGYSSASLSLPNVSGTYGSTITSVVFSGWGQTANGTASGTTYSASTPTLSTSGQMTIQAVVTDSRGRTTTKTLTITIQQYTRPTISSVLVERCDSQMVTNDQGTYAKITVTFAIASISGQNSADTETWYKLNTSSTYTNAQATFSSGTPYIIGGGHLSTDSSYNIKVIITDKAGNMATAVTSIPTATYVMHFRNGGTSVGIGRAALPQSNVLAVNENWDTYIGGSNVAKFPKHLAVVANVADSAYNNNFNNCVVAGTYIVSDLTSTIANAPVQKTGQLTVGSSMLDEHNVAIATTANCTMYQMFVASDLSDVYFRTMSTTGTAGSVVFGEWVKSNFSGTVSVDRGGTGQTTIDGIRAALNVSQDIKPGDVIDISGYKAGGWVTSSRSQFRSAICLGRRITATAVAIAGTGWIIGPGGKIVGGDNAANVTSMGTFSYTIKPDAGFISFIFSKSFSTTNNTPHTIEIATGTLTFS